MKTCKHPDGCLRPVASGGWCNAHYLRLSIHGEVGPVEVRDTRPAPRTCAFPGCSKMRSKRDWCGTHYERWRVHGDVTITHVARGNPGYLASHKQVYRRKGKASGQICAHCGGQAAQWAYDHNDPNECTGPMVVRNEVVELRYSQDAEHYIPLCVPCHVRFDAAVPA